ncbi:hypothetical protein JTE90_012925 [Oedothorax gibbosus]|uniref:Uncharacterized protein n=1 Tax=Oedothorax gibbosus TaxID=931172 RepID=A0AAV6UZ16_9ARAC|nr:hypothetical protein JTE90_012925 [Oedothorax gibbosus]
MPTEANQQGKRARDDSTVYSTAFDDTTSIPPPPPPRSSASSPASHRHYRQHCQPSMHSDQLLHPPQADDSEDTASSVDPDGPIQSYQIIQWEAQQSQLPDYATSSKHASNGDMSSVLMH